MRKAWLALVLLAAGLLLQLTVLNGLHLPGGGVPDLVLVLLVGVAIAAGPVAGTVAGFGLGLSLDLAPPGSGLIGQYALVFCLAGWAAGHLARGVAPHPVRHREQARARIRRVLVSFTEEADVGTYRIAEYKCHLRSSRTVLPMRIGTPIGTGIGRVTF